jgi:hypothetical protein
VGLEDGRGRVVRVAAILVIASDLILRYTRGV